MVQFWRTLKELVDGNENMLPTLRATNTRATMMLADGSTPTLLNQIIIRFSACFLRKFQIHANLHCAFCLAAGDKKARFRTQFDGKFQINLLHLR